MRLLSRERLQTFKHLSGTFGMGASISAAFQVLTKRPVIRSRVDSIRTPIYWRRHNSDLDALYQTLGRREADVDLGFEPKVIIDAGANIGLTSLFFANKYPGATILAVEPERGNCETFRLNCASYPNIRLLEAAVWTSDTQLAIENPNAASWAFQVIPATDSASQKIPAVTIGKLLEMTGANQVDLLKIDIEGAEKEVFENGTQQWLPRVRCLLVETHDFLKAGCEKAVTDAIAGRPHTARPQGEYTFIQFTDLPSNDRNGFTGD